jgi:decaprenyl-phosphate phosphoribosyltransferase
MLKDLARSLRIGHWYKNMLAFLGIVFERKVFDLAYFSHALLVFILLCLASSANYIVNDLVDKKKDIANQIKDQSLFARINSKISISIAALLVIASIVIAIWLLPKVVIFILLIFFLGQVYNFYAKNVPILDIVVLLLMYISRIYSGYISLDVVPYSLIVLPIVMLALFLIFIKKRSTLLILGESKAIDFRKSYSFYTIKRDDAMILISGIGMAVLYVVYFVINEKFNKIILFFTIPAVFVLIFTVMKTTRTMPELGIFLFKALKRKIVLVSSIYIVVLYFADIIFL